jgi:hypothetical protein
MGIRRSTAGRHRRHRRPAQAIVPALLALGAAGTVLTGVVTTATPAVAMHYHGHKVTSLPMMHYHG